jgi:hypothetical protein
VTLTTIPALIMRAWTASADLGIDRMNQTTSIRRDSPIRTASTSAKPVTPSPAAQCNRAASERSGALAGLKA